MLGIIRVLGSAGCTVFVIHLVNRAAGKGAKPIDSYSKYVTKYFYAERQDHEGILRLLIEHCSDSAQKPVIFTLDDKSTFIIDSHLSRIEPYFSCAHIRHQEGAIVAGMNKHFQKGLAREAGFNVVPGWPIFFEQGEYRIPGGIEYPCFVKGLLSYGSAKNLQKKCENEADLARFLSRCKKETDNPMYAERFIDVDKDWGLIGISDNGLCQGMTRADLLVMGRGSFSGVSLFGRIEPMEDASFCSKVQRLLEKIGYTGIFNLDFVEHQGEVFFVELNFRFAAYGYAVCESGNDLPRRFVELMRGEVSETNLSGGQSGYYLNEKIGLYSILDGSLSKEKYRDLRKKADYHLIKMPGDHRPYLAFVTQGALRAMRRRMKKKR